jgi:lipopolysaccharide heptosyltransferase II
MNIGLMRKLDYWLGQPLCFLLSIINGFAKCIGVRKKRDKKRIPQKILLIKLSEMGAIILSYPLIRQIKNAQPSVDIFFLTFKRNKDVFRALGAAIPEQKVITISENSSGLFIIDVLKAIHKIRKEKIDVLIDLELFSRFTAIAGYLTGIPKRIGFHRYTFEGLYRGNLLTHNVLYNPLLHISKIYLSLGPLVWTEKKSTPELNEKVDDDALILPQFTTTKEQQKHLWDKLREYNFNEKDYLLLINPGEGVLPQREWPLNQFIDLAKRFLKETEKNCVIIVGTESGTRKANELFKELKGMRSANLTGKTSLTDLLTLFNIAQVLVANDSGLGHLAALTDIRKIIIFGPESPLVYAPLGENTQIIYSHLPCSPCFSALNHRKSACRDNQCLEDIKVEDVYYAIKNNLR